MKSAGERKNKRWIWIVAAVCVILVVAGALLAQLWLPETEQEQPQDSVVSKIYWNVDRLVYTENSETGLTMREPGEDGMYHIRFAVDGQQVELPAVPDKRLINYIDTIDLMGLVFDADGVIINAMPAKEVAQELAKECYVKRIEDSRLVLNSSISMNGMEIEVPIDERTGIYEVFPHTELVGQVGKPQIMDLVTVYVDDQSNTTHVFIQERTEQAELYWRIGTHYNSANGTTTRTPDENGVYKLLFAHEGKQVELKCKDAKLVNTIDSRYYGACGLVLDSEGYIAEFVQPALAIRGKEIAISYDMTELGEKSFSATRFITGNDQGKSVSCTFDENTKIYLVCEDGTEESYIGEPTILRPNDRITCYTDLEGNVKLIFVVNRMVDSPMYFNLSRQYISSQKRTERTPDANGWYVFEMAVGGKVVTLRTKDLEIANRMDSISSQAMGLKLNGNVVEKVYEPGCVSGWTSAAVGRYITGLAGTVLSAALSSDFNNYVNFIVSADCEIYDVSGAYGKLAEKTKLRVGDEIIAFRNRDNELTHVYVTNRYVKGTGLYYNTERRYNSATRQTTRTPDAEGYYVYQMICEGKEVTIKTKSKGMAAYIDKQNAPLVALKVSGGVVREAYPAIAAVQYGQKTANFHYVASVEDGTLKTYYYSGGERRENPTSYRLDAECVIWNVSEGYVKARGEKTKLQQDDRIQAILTNPQGTITQIFVMERKIESSLYWNAERMYNATTGQTTRTPDADGYYVFQLAVKGAVRTLKTKDKALASKLDSYTTAVGLLLSGDIIKQVYPTSTVKGIKTLAVGRYDVTTIDGKNVTFTRNRPTSSNYGDVMKLKLATGCKVYDVSEYAEKFGAAVQLQPGDRVAGYIDEAGKLVYAYVVNRNTHKAGASSHCEHCGKDVFWEPYAGEIVPADVHYYLPCDTTIASRLTIGKPENENNYDVVFDLNGFHLNCTRQAFLVCDRLSVMDTAGGGAILVGNADAGIGGGIMVSGGVLKLYAGTVTMAQNAKLGNSGALVYLATDAQFDMYGGVIAGGAVASEEKMAVGGNITVTSTASFRMHGGTVSGGSAQGSGRGGNIYAAGKLELLGGQILDGIAERGGNIYLATGAAFIMKNGTVSGGVATNRGGNICDEGAASQLVGGTITAGTAQTGFGGNICITGEAKLQLSGTAVENGKAGGNGGNLAIAGVRAIVEMTGGRIVGGQCEGALGGGNLYLAGADAENAAQLVMTGGTIADGKASNGGNLRLNANSNAYLGGTVSGGTATEGASISLGSVTAKLAISGRVTGGQVYVNKDQTTTLKGAPVIDQLVIADGSRVILEDLEKGAAVTVTANGAFTAEHKQAEAWAEYFASTDAAKPVGQKDGVLYCGLPEETPEEPEIPEEPENPEIPEEPEVPENPEVPEDAHPEALRGAQVNQAATEIQFPANGTDYVADCPACGAKQVTWKAVAANGRVGYNTTGHFYCTGITQNPHTQFIGLDNGGTVCLHLNGETLQNAGRIAVLGGNSVINIMGQGTVIGLGTTTGDYKQGVLVAQNKGTINLYGGTYISKLADMPVAYVQHGDSTVNLYPDAVIDSNVGHNVDVINGRFNLYGGQIKNAVTAGSGGNVRLRAVNGRFYMYGGTICGGSSSADNAGGNVYVTGGSRFELHAGTITGGQGTGINSHGNDAYVYNGTFAMYGGTVDGQVAVRTGNGVYLDGAPVITGSGLWLEAGAKVSWGELKENTSVTVCAEGAFTEANEKAAEYAPYFKTSSQLSKILLKENVLYCESDCTADPAAPLSDRKRLKVLTQQDKAVIMEAVNAALRSPFEVTQSACSE